MGTHSRRTSLLSQVAAALAASALLTRRWVLISGAVLTAALVTALALYLTAASTVPIAEPIGPPPGPSPTVSILGPLSPVAHPPTVTRTTPGIPTPVLTLPPPIVIITSPAAAEPGNSPRIGGTPGQAAGSESVTGQTSETALAAPPVVAAVPDIPGSSMPIPVEPPPAPEPTPTLTPPAPTPTMTAPAPPPTSTPPAPSASCTRPGKSTSTRSYSKPLATASPDSQILCKPSHPG